MIKRFFYISILIIIIFSSKAYVQTTQDVIGARPAGMGEAFVGVADDGNALYWNPAGMAFLNHHEITSMYTDLYGIGVNNSYLAYTYPITDRFALGFDWSSLSFQDFELEYNLNKFNFGASYKVLGKLGIGGHLRYMNTSTSFDNQSLGKGNGLTADIGALFKVLPNLSAGAVLRNISKGYITYDNGSKALLEDREVRVGIGYKPFKELLLATDIGDRLHLGGEYIYKEILLLRMGVQRDLQGERETIYSFGAGIRYGPLHFDYSLTDYPHLNSTTRISLSASFNFGFKAIKVKNIELATGSALFPSLWHRYTNKAFLEFDLENRGDEPVECSWEVVLEDMVDAPTIGKDVLRPKEIKNVKVVGSFSKLFYLNPSDQTKKISIKTTYRSGRKDIESVNEKQIFVYSKGAIDWNEDKNWVAAFINPRDAYLRGLATSLIQEWRDQSHGSQILSNISQAMLIFNALRANGLKYLPDANNPYYEIQNKPSAVDDIQYPADLLATRAGDCDDLTVLFSSMLESIGISTIIIDVPEHLYLMFDTEVPWVQRIALLLPDDLIVKYKGRCYIPIEVTSIDKGFMRAWDVGASSYHRWEAMNELSLIDLQYAWQNYPPIPVETPKQDFGWSTKEFASLMLQDWSEFDRVTDKFQNENYYDPIKIQLSSSDELNRIAVLAVKENNLNRARVVLERAYELYPADIDVINNLANIYALEGDFESAEKLYFSIGDTAYFAENVVTNLVVAKSLSINPDLVSERESLIEWLNDLQEMYSNVDVDSVRLENIIGCIINSNIDDRLEIALCLKKAIEVVKAGYELSEKGHIVNEHFPRAMRAFNWYY